MSSIDLQWLVPLKAKQTPVSFGTPWEKGKLHQGEAVCLEDQTKKQIPVQTRINAYWPDGSVKWLLHTAVLDTEQSYTVSPGKGPEPTSIISATQDNNGTVKIESELLTCTISTGEFFIHSLQRKANNQKPVAAELKAYIENREEHDGDERNSVYSLIGVTKKITLEENGPLRAVVKLEGEHHYVNTSGQLFPYVLRLYFYAGSDEIRMVHSFIYDGDGQKDFLKGIAVQFHLQAEGALWNRHVGFTGDTGMFYEAIQPMYTIRGVHPLYEQQQGEGQFVTISPEEDSAFYKNVSDNAAWGDFRLQQHSCDHYDIIKRTRSGCSYITAAQGNRSAGALFFGCPSIILAAGIKDLWQKSPMALEITGALGDNPSLTLWLWSKYTEAYDFRAYDTIEHHFSYGELGNHPEGIANTNEIYVKLFDQMPGKQAIFNFAEDIQSDALLIANPNVYEETKVFGSYWIPPKEEKYKTAAYEKAFIGFVDYYRKEVEQRRWYGFWDYGDVMHTYDPVRHCWRYDVGGFAWQNTELCNTYVNWLAFLRTGDYNIYRFARAMTRHTSEVDTYHLGKFAMLGTRHNVRHWGCKYKEPRISMAGHHRFFYYLTGDERIGDIMDFVKDSDKVYKFDQMEEVSGRLPVRTGPDWSSYVSNWMTRWERFQDTKYRNKIIEGLNSLKKAPNRLASGSAFLYDPSTGHLEYIGDGNYQYHMVICFGGPEIWFELADLLEETELKDMLAQFGDFFGMTPEERTKHSEGLFNETNDGSWGGVRFGIRMLAYAGYWNNNPERLRQALEMLDQQPDHSSNTPGQMDEEGNLIYTTVERMDYIRDIHEVEYANTNGISQWSLNYIETAKIRELAEENQTNENE